MVVTLLGLNNNSSTLNYDEKGFLIPNEDYEPIFFGDNWRTTGIVSFVCRLLDSNNTFYKYKISIRKESLLGQFTSTGTITITHRDGKIIDVHADDNKNGYLIGTDGEQLDLPPESYIHLIKIDKN